MLSDESSSDSETGRFKCRTKENQDETNRNSRKEDSFRSSLRGKNTDERYNKDFDRRRGDRDRIDRFARDRDRDRSRFSRNSPSRRRFSRERSPARRSPDRSRHDRDVRGLNRPPGRSDSRERSKHSRFRHKSSDRKRDLKEEIRRNLTQRERSPEKPRRHSKDRLSGSPEKTHTKEKISLSPEKSVKRERISRSPERLHRRNRITISPEKPSRKEQVKISPDRPQRKSKDRTTITPDRRSKRSEIYKPAPNYVDQRKKKSESPIIVEEHSSPSDEVQLGSYYSMIPAVVKDKSEESSEIDSSDDEKLRAKLLNLEKELHKTKKKKHKRKHKKKHSKSDKESDQDTTAVVEVSSTTDIPCTEKPEDKDNLPEVVEVTSTQKNSQKESGEEGEIISDDDSQNRYEIDPTDLRHKLKRSVAKLGERKDVCGPALPPHLSKSTSGSKSPSTEGPALPPHLKGKSRHMGPSIPDDMRKILHDKEPQYESSDEDVGIGPLPSGSEEKWSDAHKRLEERALDMKIRNLDGHNIQKSDVKSREEWMLELPEGKAKYIGLEARSFRAKAGPDMSDRSSWTDTPEEKARKAAGIVKDDDSAAALQREARARQISNRDDEQETAVKKHKKKHKRDESLLELHQKKIKKKKKKDDKDDDKKERRPFSRDVDLQVNRFDEAQKRSIIKKAQALDTRFSRGEAKYL